MKLNLNNAELTAIMNLISNAINVDALYDFEIATFKNVLDKINNNIEFKHHNVVDDAVCTILVDFYSEKVEGE